MLRISVMLAAFVLLLPATGFAENSFARNGFYVGAAGALAEKAPNKGDTDGAFGVAGRIGYRFHPHISGEVQFEALKGGTEVYTANAKGYLTTGSIQIYVLTGLGLLNANSDTSFAARTGAGLDMYVTDDVAVTVGTDYVITTGSHKKSHYLSFIWGLQYRF
jgi:hypothetical protein